MQLEEVLHNHPILKEKDNYFLDNQSLSFGEKVRTNSSFDIANIIEQNKRKDELSFSLTDNRRFFLDKKENKNNIIESVNNSFIDSKNVKFFNSLNLLKTIIPIPSINPKEKITIKKKEESANLECRNKKEKKRTIKAIINPKKSKKIKIKKVHLGSDDDNILRKIQVHFLSFIICFANDVVRALTGKKLQQFKNIDYEQKKIVNHKFVEDLKSKTIGDILKFNITPKMKNNEKQANKYIYENILKECPSIDEFFKMNYLTLFKEYYFNKNNIFQFNGKIIPLSEKTKEKTFNYFIIKHHSYLEKIKYVCINYYLNCYKRMKKPNFTTKLCNKSNQKEKIEVHFILKKISI